MKFAYVSCAALLSAGAASAATYTNPASFLAAAGPVSTVDFQGCGSSTRALSAGVSVSSSSGGCTGIPADVTFSPQSTGNSLYIAGANQRGNSSTALGVNTPSGGYMTIAFTSPETSFGTALSTLSTAGVFTLNFFSLGTSVATYDQTVNGTGYFGLTGTTSFDSVRVSEANTFAVVDDVSYGPGAASAVPEPSSWALMMLGFGGVGYAIRRRPKTGARIRFA